MFNYENNESYNWGKMQIESLKKMFLNKDELKVEELDTEDGYKTKKAYKTYLFAMPQAYNEAISYVYNAKPFIKEITIDNSSNEEMSFDVNTLDRLKNIISSTYGANEDGIIKVPAHNTLNIKYGIYPKFIDSTTPSNEPLDIPYDVYTIIPLYIAGELYKEDKLSLSTMYMNEFFTQISTVLRNNPSQIEQIEDLYGLF